jgi:hypothetical protein
MSESYWLAMKCETPESAEICLTNLIHLAMEEEPTLTEEKAREIQLQNIGYYTGYLPRDRALKVLELFGTEHPIFGHFERDISPDKALKAGMAISEATREGKTMPEAIKAARDIIES